jgi:hypothetical protein
MSSPGTPAEEPPVRRQQSSQGWPRRWPLVVLALPAGVATWTGWVGLGAMCGFGKVCPLPGIADSWTINSAITLPIGVEAYAAIALSAWLTPARTCDKTRSFARTSAIGALVLGMLGQVAYHLLEVTHNAEVAALAEESGRTFAQVARDTPAHAPWWVTTLVSCLPVLVLGLGAALAHMIHRDRMLAEAAHNATGDREAPAGQRSPADPSAVPVSVPSRPDGGDASPDTPGCVPSRGSVRPPVPGPATPVPVANGAALPAPCDRPAPADPARVRAVQVFAADLAAGQVPSIRSIKAALRCGQTKASQVRTYLAALDPRALPATGLTTGPDTSKENPS